MKHADQGAGDLPAGLSRPAQRAPAGTGYSQLKQLAGERESEILQVHGIGPTARDQLRRALATRELSFADESPRNEG